MSTVIYSLVALALYVCCVVAIGMLIGRISQYYAPVIDEESV